MIFHFNLFSRFNYPGDSSDPFSSHTFLGWYNPSENCRFAHQLNKEYYEKKFNVDCIDCINQFNWFFLQKKSTSTDSSSTPTTATPTTNNTGSSLSVNGTSQYQSNAPTILKGVSNNADYQIVVAGDSWTLGFLFPGTNLPANGSYTLQDSTDNHLKAGKAFLSAAGPNNFAGIAHTGVVTVSSGNTITFNNIVLLQPSLPGTTAASYTLSGTIRY